MGIICKVSTSLVIVGSLVVSLHAQIINLSGTVRDTATLQGIPYAQVYLANQKLLVSADSIGFYSFGAATGVEKFAKPGERLEMPAFSGSRLLFCVSKPGTRVSIDIFTINGRHAASVLDAVVQPGNYSVNPFIAGLSSQVTILKVKIGENTSVFRMNNADRAQKGAGSLLAGAGSPGSQADLKKTAAAADTLIACAPGYYYRFQPVSSLSGTNDIPLARDYFSTDLKAGDTLVYYYHLCGYSLEPPYVTQLCIDTVIHDKNGWVIRAISSTRKWTTTWDTTAKPDSAASSPDSCIVRNGLIVKNLADIFTSETMDGTMYPNPPYPHYFSDGVDTVTGTILDYRKFGVVQGEGVSWSNIYGKSSRILIETMYSVTYAGDTFCQMGTLIKFKHRK